MNLKVGLRFLLALFLCIWLNYSYWLQAGAKETHSINHGNQKKGVITTSSPKITKLTKEPKKPKRSSAMKKAVKGSKDIQVRVATPDKTHFREAQVIDDHDFRLIVHYQADKMKDYMIKESSKKKKTTTNQLLNLQQQPVRETGHVLCYSHKADNDMVRNSSIADICDTWDSNNCLASPAAGSSPLLHNCNNIEKAAYRSCAHLHLTRSLHIGGKTALYKGKFKDADVGVKHYPAILYEGFVGFHLFTSHSALRHPWINYPSGACLYEGNILQTQPFLKGYDLTKWKEKKKKKLEFGEIIKWGIRIACIHVFMHSHPDGPFTYDDNHPGQYFITEEGPVMVDIDTMQKVLPNGTSVCRCFGCNGGRANCQFINSPEGFRHCSGSSTEPTCGIQTDIWFLAQLLYGLLPKGTLTPMSKFGKDVSSAVLRGEIPHIESKDEDYTNLVKSCFAQEPTDRPTASQVVLKLINICEKYDNCDISECPDSYIDTIGYRDA